MPTSLVHKRRNALLAAGLRPVQIWVPYTSRPGFAAECRRQSQLVSQTDSADVEIMEFMDSALDDMSQSTPIINIEE